MHSVKREFKIKVNARPEIIWKYISQLGMKNGWYIWGHFFNAKYTPVVIRERIVEGMNADFFKVVSAAEGRWLHLKTGRSYMDVYFDMDLVTDGGKNTIMIFATTMEIKNFFGSLYWLFIQVPDEFLQGMMMANIKKYSEYGAAAQVEK
jgi:hypothetical protein